MKTKNSEEFDLTVYLKMIDPGKNYILTLFYKQKNVFIHNVVLPLADSYVPIFTFISV